MLEDGFNDSTKSIGLKRRTASALALLLGFGLFAPVFGQQAPPAQVSEKIAEATDLTQTSSPSEVSRTFISAAKRVRPAVVHVKVGTRGATGSGVIISSDGYILTNNHVASYANELTVRLSDGRELRARRIGVDQTTDLALIKIEAQNLPYATLGDSSRLEQGEWVIALGSPFGLEQTMTRGAGMRFCAAKSNSALSADSPHITSQQIIPASAPAGDSSCSQQAISSPSLMLCIKHAASSA
jgi:S1-C subfamily serine protease